MNIRTLLNRVLLCLIVAAAVPALADEGMWTFDNFPAATVKQKFGADITPAWLDRVRLSTIRLSNCTASFVSPEGLILTNHHCSAQCLAEISSPGTDRVRDGFVATDRSKELRCPTQYADVLTGIENITAKVADATRGKDDKAANDARKKVLTQLEEACETAAGKKDPRNCESVKLYQGGQYFLYKYKRYSDVRITFAPEEAIAAFGGDPDNFQFPRWCLDMSVLRAYENGKPAKTPNFLPFNWQGPAENELTFVTGHPGSTDRLLTVAQLNELRSYLPFWLLRYAELRGRYLQFSTTSPENARIAGDQLKSLENSIKVRRKQLDALLDNRLMAEKGQAEVALRAKGAPGAAEAWTTMEKATQREQELRVAYTFLEGNAGFNSSLFRYARALVRGATERAKPNDERLREFTEGSLAQLEQQITAPVPIYPELEKLTLSFGFERMREFLGPDHPLVHNLLKEDSPESLATSLVNNTKLGDPALRKQLWEGGQAAIAASKDPMIRLAALVDPELRANRKQFEDEVEAPIEAASEKIAAGRFAALGTSVYPDATFTLRLNFGTVQGWKEAGTQVPSFTRLSRAFERSTGSDPFRMPDSWLKVRDKLDMQTPFNISTNNDIVGGNSGSPMINAKAQIVGLMFDGNIHSISGSYWFDTEKNRSVAVHPAIIREALTKVYDAKSLAAELGIR